MNVLRRLISSTFAILSGLALFSVPGCGGGTSGSGLKTYKGVIDDTSNRVLSGVEVTIETTGDRAKTDDQGSFSLQSNASGAEVPFLIESPAFISRFVLKEIPERSAHISMSVTVDPQTDIATVDQLNVRAGFVGLCNNYFENGATIRQANHVPEGTLCTLKVRVIGDGQPLVNVPIAVQYSRCEEPSNWRTIDTSRTEAGEDAGATKFTFPFYDSAEFCRYRVVAPYESTDHFPVYYPIDTFTEQKIFATPKSR